MKKIFIIFAFIGIFLSCDEEPEKILFEGPHFVFFESGASLSILESSDEIIEIPVKISLAQSTDVSIQLQITSSSAVENSDFEILSPEELTIEAGEYETLFRFRAINNDVLESEKRIVSVKILSASEDIDVQVLGEVSIEIVNDDCAFDINNFVGAYTVEITSEFDFGNPAGLYVSETSLTLGSAPNTLVDASFWDFGNSVVITLDPSNPSSYTASLVGAQLVYNNASGLARYAIQGTQPLGSFTTCDGGLIVNMELTRENQTTVANRSVIKYIKK
jgi:hypothetical protein